MLPKALLRAIRVAMKVGQIVASFPVIWDPKRQEARAPATKRFYVRWYCCTVYIYINSVFMIIRLVQAACCMNMPYGKLFLNLYNVITWLCGSAYQLNTINHQKDLVEFINHLMKINKYFEQIQRDAGGSPGNGGGSYAKKFTYAIYIYCSMQFFIALTTMDKNPKYFFTLTGIQGVARWKILPLAMFECYMSFHIASLMLFYAMFFLAYVKTTTMSLNIIRKENPVLLPAHFRMLQVLNNQFNGAFRSIAIPGMFFTLMTINILSSYASLRMYGEVKMPGFLGFPMNVIATAFMILDVVPAAYRIFEASEILFRDTIQTVKPNSVVDKVLFSCQPLCVQVGAYFRVKRITTMTFVGFIIDHAIMMLLTF